MNNFEIGGKCVCINSDFPTWVLTLYTELPKEGQIYVIRDIRLGAAFRGKQKVGAVSLLLIGLNNPHAEGAKAGSSLSERGFNSDRFRPLDEVQEENKDNKPESNPTEICHHRKQQEHETEAN